VSGLNGMKIGYLDPPYIGQSRRHYGDHPDYAGEVDHRALAVDLRRFDGWVLHCSVPSLRDILGYLDDAGEVDHRVMAWVKPFAAFKRNVPVAYAWEPVIVSPARKPVVAGRVVMRDWIAESITMQRGLSGAKPEEVCRWAFEVVGAEPNDELIDVYPGTWAFTRAWERWCANRRNPGTAPAPSEDRFAKLPKWAQLHIAALEAELAESAVAA
jgi:hypothetical protein